MGSRPTGSRPTGSQPTGSQPMADLQGAKDGIKEILNIIQCSGIGPQRRITTAIIFDDEIKIICGCFVGSLAQFDDRIKLTHANNPKHLAGYNATVVWILANAEVLRKEKNDADTRNVGCKSGCCCDPGGS